ncbi:CoA-disulfide reductase family protein [Treponema lecithinolyticum ATCC 700332]|uniref:CoA-disulfide reductase family protein n=2 Tax=Treponema lecithinolyticum TaxID=53418 RepID=A0ABN0NXM7_TRELE|nr:CoA-disulfide reductase family protein [Treponema lecithinolyticum ATCC 700332]
MTEDAFMTTGKKILIVGGVAGGAGTAARLRRLDENARIILFERGSYISFANCALPYYIGGEITDKNALTVQTVQSFTARFNVDVRIHSNVTAIHPDTKTVSVHDTQNNRVYEESYDSLVLSPGAEPVRPPIEGIQSERVFTLRSIPDTFAIKEFIEKKHARSAAIVGGGFIGIEMAENLKRAGVEVTLIEMADQVIAPVDYDIACEVHAHLQEKGVRLQLNSALSSVSDTGSALDIQLTSGNVKADMMILAIGVNPESALAHAAGLKLSPKGAIVVDEHMRTSDPSIYALGDAVQIKDFVSEQDGYVPLAGPANKQARIVADVICGVPSSYCGTQGSSIIKAFDLTVGATGINEKTAKRLGIAYEKSFTYSSNHASYYPGAQSMSIKTLYDPQTGSILGAQIVGREGVDKRLDVFATAIRARMKAADLAQLELSYAPPYNSAKDPVNIAGFVIENIRSGRMNIFHWHDVKALIADDTLTLLDVRSPAEYERSHVEGWLNFPLDDIRKRLGELDKTKPVYLMCQIGLRGYIASRILVQHGFTVYNLSGGYRLYDLVSRF